MYHHYLGHGSREGTPSSAPLHPETLFKRSHLHLDVAKNKISLKAVSHAGLIGPNADAKCVGGGKILSMPRLHISSAPSRSCTCGFYGYRKYRDALNHPQSAPFILQVVASGKMLEYDKGYRYSHQRVEQVIAPECAMCVSLPDHLVITLSTGKLTPVCRYHSTRPPRSSHMSFSEFEETFSAALPEGAPPVTLRKLAPLNA